MPARTSAQLTADPTAAHPNRLLYLTPTLKNGQRLSGTPEVTVRASVDGRSPYLTAYLVDYGEDTRVARLERRTGQTWCFGDSLADDSGCRDLYEYVTEKTPYRIVTRGWLDVRNRHSASRTDPIQPGQDYSFRWKLEPTDYVFKPGHRIGVVITSTDHDYTLRYPAGTRVGVRTGASSVRLPLLPVSAAR